MNTSVLIPCTNELYINEHGVIYDKVNNKHLPLHNKGGGKFWVNLPIEIKGETRNLTLPIANIAYCTYHYPKVPIKFWPKVDVSFIDPTSKKLTVDNLKAGIPKFKDCITCKESKLLSDYYKHGAMSDGHLNKCKECAKRHSKENEALNGKSRNQTVKGIVRVLYKTQKQNQLKRGHGELPYTKKEFREWLFKNNFQELYNIWVKGNYEKDLKPSVDRLDSTKGYTFDNMELITWGENKKRQYGDIANGTGTSGKRCKALLQLDKDGNLVKRHVSYNQAQREMGYSLEYAIKNDKLCRNNYYWKYDQPLTE